MQKDLIIYEMNIRAFTADESSGLDPSIRGSYLGVIEKVKPQLFNQMERYDSLLFENDIHDCLV